MMENLQDQQQNSYYKLFMESPSVGILIDAATGEIVGANNAAVGFYGYSARELCGMKIADLSLPDEEVVFQHRQAVCQSGGECLKNQHRLKNGEIRTVGIYSNRINIAARELIYAVIIDLTMSLRIIQACLESEKKLRDFAQAIPDMSAIIDEDGLYVEVFGKPETSVINGIKLQGHTLHEVFPKELADRMLRDIRDTIQTGQTNSFIREIDLGSKKGCFEGRTSSMRFIAQGKKTAAVIVSDISERLRIERKLQFAYELQRRSDFINDVISESIDYDEKMVESAAKWGVDFSRPLYCSLIDIKEGSTTGSQGVFSDIQDCKNKILSVLGSHDKYIVWDNHDKIGILCQEVSSVGHSVQGLIAEAEEINQRIKLLCPRLQVTIGLSDVHQGRASIQKSYQEAWNTLISAQCQTERSGGIYHFRDMGLFQILTTFYGNSDTSEYVRKMLGPLINYDVDKGTELLITLEEILRGNNLKDTAQKMFIHHKTLVFRKQRIEKILGVSLEEFETRLALAAAIKLYKLGNINK